MRKPNTTRKLQLSRETIRYLDQSYGGTDGAILVKTIAKTIGIIIDTIRQSEDCPYSHSIDPPGCCITIRPCNP